jgi:hypothetical protein
MPKYSDFGHFKNLHGLNATVSLLVAHPSILNITSGNYENCYFIA